MWRSRAPAALVVLAVLASGCTGSEVHPATGSPRPGGVYRTAVVDFAFTDGFDPTGEYGGGWTFYSELLLRTLLTYRHVAGPRGLQLVPDLAEAAPAISPDGLTYTFRLKDGIRFGPPVGREITARDVEYAFRRIDAKPLVAQYGFYFDGVVQGMNGARPTMPRDISGIDSSDDKTLVFHLQRPTGDFLYRLALPATAPIPAEAARCFRQAGDYGRDVIASGPYMIQGSNHVDISSCSSIRPMSGFDPNSKLVFVRNPDYDPSTDDPSVRENLLDGISVVVDTNAADIFDKIDRGELDGSIYSQIPNTVLARYESDPSLRPFLHSSPTDAVFYLSMNLLAPPFDDVHVRRAVNLVLDKAALQQEAGGPVQGDVATHVLAPALVPEFPSGWDPYATPGHAGDVEAARAEMRRSRYDHDGDGRCDDPVCSRVLMMAETDPPFATYTPLIESDLERLGIHLLPRELTPSVAYQTAQRVRNLVPLYEGGGWFQDYPDPETFAVLFRSAGIQCQGQVNLSEVGMTERQAGACGVLDAYRRAGAPPSVDARIDRCEALPPGAGRTACWIAFDQAVMTDVVPWVPYRWTRMTTIVGPSVTHYVYDQALIQISLCHIAVDNGLTAADLG